MARGKRWTADYCSIVISMARTKLPKQIAAETGIKLRTIQRFIEEHKRYGNIARGNLYKELRGRKRSLTVRDIEFLKRTLRINPDLLLDELKEQLDKMGVAVDESTIWRAISRAGWTLKNLTRIALEHNEEKRATYRYLFGLQYAAEQAVFVDESSFDRRTAMRKRGWAPIGERVYRNCFFVRGRRYSLLPALTLEGVIHARIVEGSFTSNLFLDFIEGLPDYMQPFPAPRSVIVMDSCCIHKDPRIIELVEQRGMRVMFLPPYSPDYNPIELAFSAIKAYVRRAQVLGRADLQDEEDDLYVYQHSFEAAYAVGPRHGEGYFHHCNYI